MQRSAESGPMFNESEISILLGIFNRASSATDKEQESPFTAAVPIPEDNSENIGNSGLDALDLQAPWSPQVDPEKIEEASPDPLPDGTTSVGMPETFVEDVSETPLETPNLLPDPPPINDFVAAPIPAPHIEETPPQTEKQPEIGITDVIENEEQHTSRQKSLFIIMFTVI
ncbi:MAG: hypothetical protein WCL71_14010 [Deltaproteobacteria bacterium]